MILEWLVLNEIIIIYFLNVKEDFSGWWGKNVRVRGCVYFLLKDVFGYNLVIEFVIIIVNMVVWKIYEYIWV